MKDFAVYLIQSGLSLAVFYGIFRLFLKKETFFAVNRIFLLSTSAISLLIPLVRIPGLTETVNLSGPFWLSSVVVLPEGSTATVSTGYSMFQWIVLFYSAGTIFFLMRFVYRITGIVRLLIRSELTSFGGDKIALTDEDVRPFSFFGWIVINKNFSKGDQFTNILQHEKIHIRQYHSMDLLFMEMITIFQWANPFAWLIKKALKDQHEYLADKGVLNKGTNRKEYLELLISQAFGFTFSPMANNFNHSQIKNRITMITKRKSSQKNLLRTTVALPALIALVYMFSVTFNIDLFANQNRMMDENNSSLPVLQGQEDEVYTVVEQMPEFPGGEEARTKFFIDNITYPKEALKNGIQGRVFVTFVVEKDGKITNVRVLRGIGGGCDEEAARVISLMPDWKPGKHKGKPVRVQFNLPVQFKLDKNEKDNTSGTAPPKPPKSPGIQKAQPDSPDKR